MHSLILQCQEDTELGRARCAYLCRQPTMLYYPLTFLVSEAKRAIILNPFF